MSLKDLSGKCVYDLDFEDFEKLFCKHCIQVGVCDKDPKSVNVCMGLIDSGVWDRQLRRRS